MKKLLSIFLSLLMVFSIVPVAGLVVSAGAAEVTATEETTEKLPLIFVTGIGQTFSYIRNDNGEDTFTYQQIAEDGTYYNEDIPYNKTGNLVNFDFSLVLKHLLSNPIELFKSLTAVVQLFKSIFTGDYCVKDDNFSAIVKELLYLNLVDEEGNLPEEVVTPYYTYPISEYINKSYFYKRVPCEDLIQGDERYGENRVFCFNYAPFGSIEERALRLKEYINNVQEKYFPGQQVILVPMSMGATVVSHYLKTYGNEEGCKGDVAKVISVVGCWDGSDVFADLIEGKYADKSPEVFYQEITSFDKLDPAWSSLLNVVIHLFSKKTLTPLAKNLVNILRDELLLKASTMCALIPSNRYEAIREKYLTRPGYEKVLEEADNYHQTQLALQKDTVEENTMLYMNDKYGTEFYFISGYGLGFGEVTSDYTFFKCFESAWTTNSDEVIPIDSTTVGATSVTPGTQLSEEYKPENPRCTNPDHNHISPDGSIDLSTAVFPDNCFVFYNQKHELEHNNIALEIVLNIALGNNKDNPDTAEDEAEIFNKKYPQFNNGRDLEPLKDYTNKFNSVLLDNGEKVIDKEKDTRTYKEALGTEYEGIAAEAKEIIKEVANMKKETVINPDKDAAVINKAKALYEEIDLIINGESVADKLAPFTKALNDIVYFFTGPQGIPDLFKKK